MAARSAFSASMPSAVRLRPRSKPGSVFMARKKVSKRDSYARSSVVRVHVRVFIGMLPAQGWRRKDREISGEETGIL